MSDIDLNGKEFQDKIINSDLPSMVDFYAEWCGPCKMMGPIIEQLASEYKRKMNIYKLNVDTAQEIAVRYGISGVPTVLFFKNGEKVGQFTGARPKEQIDEYISKFL